MQVDAFHVLGILGDDSDSCFGESLADNFSSLFI